MPDVSTKHEGDESKTTSPAATAPSPPPSSSTPASPSDGWKAYTSADIMQASSDKNETVILYSDPSLNWVCNGGTWSISKLNDSLSGRTTSGQACFVEYTFTGDRVQILGAQSTSTGVFGCSVDSNPLWSGWWDGSSSANLMLPYKGMCDIAGIGYGRHTVRFVNSPYKARDAIFTGLRYSKNTNGQPWANPSISGCCAEYTFPSGVSTAIDPGATDLSKGALSWTNWEFIFAVVVTVVALAALAGILLGVLVCKRRPKVDPVIAALKGTTSDKASHRHHKRRRLHERAQKPARAKKQKKAAPPPPTPSETSSDDEKQQQEGSSDQDTLVPSSRRARSEKTAQKDRAPIQTDERSSSSSSGTDEADRKVERNLRPRQPYPSYSSV